MLGFSHKAGFGDYSENSPLLETGSRSRFLGVGEGIGLKKVKVVKCR